MHSDIRKHAKWAEASHWTVYDDANGYTHFVAPDGTHVYTYPATPGRPHRRMRELEQAFKRNNLEWPPPSKSVQRSRRKRGEQS